MTVVIIALINGDTGCFRQRQYAVARRLLACCGFVLGVGAIHFGPGSQQHNPWGFFEEAVERC